MISDASVAMSYAWEQLDKLKQLASASNVPPAVVNLVDKKPFPQSNCHKRLYGKLGILVYVK